MPNEVGSTSAPLSVCLPGANFALDLAVLRPRGTQADAVLSAVLRNELGAALLMIRVHPEELGALAPAWADIDFDGPLTADLHGVQRMQTRGVRRPRDPVPLGVKVPSL
ncbi:hypothetical protein ACIA8C_33600 [Nocardia sp. NPDC051321]|uniref:hypothetical protein n=1 Tax=Nocardia sp. NPDC051321 TaxID=3364323 RepID=UPI00379F1352